jgi:gliding motility-associated-like protein
MKALVLVCCLFFVVGKSSGQGCFPDNDDTTITLNCSQNCANVRFTIPDLRESSSYKVIDIPYEPLPFSDPRGIPITFSGSWPGNSYSSLQNLPFNFCFFDSSYNSLVVGSNGTVSFDASMAGGWCDPLLKRGPALFPLPNARYAKALIAAVMHDLDPGDTARVSPNRRIDFRIVGDAPCRKVVINFFQVPLWPGPQRNCQSSINTHQIILYESTGIIDVFIKDSPNCNGSNEGYNTLGIQNFARDLAYFPRNKNCAQWGGSDLNLGYRFLPHGGNSRLQSTTLLLNGADVGSSATITPAVPDDALIVTFPDICPARATNTLVLRAVYSACPGPGTIELYDTIYLNKTNSLAATAIARPAQCTSNTGMIIVDVPTLGIPPYSYSLNGGPPQTSNVFPNLAPGPYVVTVRDATICSDNINVVVGSISTLNVVLTTTNTSCNHSADGSIIVDPGPGMNPILYSLNGGPFQTSGRFLNLAPGIYNIAVADAAGCISANNRATILAGPPLSTNFSKTDITCFGNTDGSIIIETPNTGSAPYLYSIDGINFQASNVFNNLAAGNYIIRFRDVNGCNGQLTVSIIEPLLLQASATSSPVFCNGQQNGTITVQPNGGTMPYEYSLDGITFQSSNLFSVGAGNYSVYMRDRNGCFVSVPNITVTEPAVIFANAVSSNATCDGGNDGQITISATGGIAGYTYSLDGINFQSSNVFNVAPGLYNANIRDANGCTANISGIEVKLTNNLSVSPINDATICEGEFVQLDLASNATAFSWTPSGGLSNPAIHNPQASPTVTTQYLVTATLGICSAYDTIIIKVNDAPIPNAGPDGNICVGQTFNLQGSGGLSYEWSPATYLSNPLIANPVVNPERSVEYSLRVVDANGCRSLQPDMAKVEVTPPIKVEVTPSDTIVSAGDQFRILAISSATSYSWTPSTGLSRQDIADPVVTAGNAGNILLYKVTAFTSAGCKGEAYVRVQVYKGPDLYVPTAFTPNGDGKNDLFYPFPVGVKNLIYFRVFNRWGQLVFSTSSLLAGWDGKFGGREEATGVYIWDLQALTRESKLISKKGTVTLIR